jgi:hypothetical protein
MVLANHSSPNAELPPSKDGRQGLLLVNGEQTPAERQIQPVQGCRQK